MKNFLAPLALLTLAPLSVLRADQISYTEAVRAAQAGKLTEIHVPGFDPKLGELQRIDVQFEARLMAGVDLENTKKSREWAHLELEGFSTLRTAGSRELLISGNSHAEADVLLAVTDGRPDMQGASSAHVAMGLRFQDRVSLASNFDEFIGTKVALLAGMRAGFELTAEGVKARVSTEVAYQVRITYTYEAKPSTPPDPKTLDATPELNPGRAIKPGKPDEVEKA